jgi:hypothetical protein
MLNHLNRDRPPRDRPWPERTHRRSDPDSGSLIVVCGLSLVGLATSLFVIGSSRMAETFPHGFAIAVLEAAIIATAVCAIVAVADRLDE